MECRLEEEEEKEEEEEVVGLAPADQLSTCEAAAVELRPSWSAHLCLTSPKLTTRWLTTLGFLCWHLESGWLLGKSGSKRQNPLLLERTVIGEAASEIVRDGFGMGLGGC